MKNIVATIPRAKFTDWKAAEKACLATTGDPLFWLINVTALPGMIKVGESVCYMVYDAQVRGYFDIITTDVSENWRRRHRLGKKRTTKCLVLANWHPVANGPHLLGFQGYRYIDLRP